MSKVVVVTGSTRGIGLGLAREFLSRGCRVVVSGRSHESVDKALADLGSDEAVGLPCDVSDRDSVQALWDFAASSFGAVDVWINNAGVSTTTAMLWELDPAEIEASVATNVFGSIWGSQVALAGFTAQGKGQLWNMEGFGSEGRMRAGMTVYGTTKYGVRYLTRSLMKEVEGTPVQVGTLSPGMVVTDMLVGEYDRSSAEWKRVSKIFNILADKVETVTPWLADQVLATNKSGAKVAWLTPAKVAKRFATSPFNKRDLFS